MKFTIKNYRCFTEKNPLVFEIKDDVIAFVGPNNSGKSSVLKFFFELKPLWSALFGDKEGVRTSVLGPNRSINFDNIVDQMEVFTVFNNKNIIIEIDSGEKDGFNKIEIIIYRNPVRRYELVLYFDNQKIDKTETPIIQANWPNNDTLNIRTRELSVSLDFSDWKIFFAKLINSIYIPAYRNLINVGGKENYYGISVGTNFMSLWEDWKTGAEKEKTRIIQNVQVDIQEILGFGSIEINHSPSLKTLQVDINNESYKISELGSGIAQFIIVLGNVAIKKPSFIFIDEPEANLHPTLQLKFLMALNNYATNGVVFATHSVGLARSAAERIYSISLNEEKHSVSKDFEKITNLVEFLGEMSFSSFNDLGFDKLLLVEGVTEIKAMQQFLRKKGLDNKIIMLPLGGNSLINKNREHELSDLKRISENVFALIDSEKKSEEAELESNRGDF